MGGHIQDLTGMRFGKLIAVKRQVKAIGPKQQKHSFWICECDCGKTVSIRAIYLLGGNTKSCGCAMVDMVRENSTIHGMKGTRFYNTWNHMKQRMTNPNNKSYKWYGGKGLILCEKWHDFQGFYDDMYGPYLSHAQEHGEENTTIERKNNNLGYCPDNCRWATIQEQTENIERHINHYLVNGEWLSISEISRKYQINANTLRQRLSLGWSMERITSPPLRRGSCAINSR